MCWSPPTISLIERAPRRRRYNDTYKDHLGKPREKNVRSARPKREKIKKRLHGHITNSNTSQEYTKCILPIVHGTSAEQLACQVHRSQSATTTPLAATPLCGHPPTIWEGLPTEWGLRVSGASLTKMSPETTTSLQADGTTKRGTSRRRILPSNALRGEEAPKEGRPAEVTTDI